MADNQDADIDEIIGQEDLELDEIDNDSGVPSDNSKDGDSNDDSKDGEDTGSGEDTKEPEANPDVKPEGEQPPIPDGEKPEEVETPEAPQPLTKEDVLAAINDARTEERNATKEIDELTDNVLKQYYPEGLSNVLVDEKSGKELRSPQDVVDASGGDMSIEEATKWLMNEQYKLDQNLARIKDDARNLAETNSNFRTGVDRVLTKYKDVFEKFPKQQEKIYKAYMKQVKLDSEKDLVLSAPDVDEFYDLFMEPYVLAYGNMQAQQPPAPTSAPQGEPDKPQIPDAKPSVEDRLDESGDVGSGGRETDPNNADESLKELFGE